MKFALIACASTLFAAVAAPAVAGDSRTFDLPEFDRIDASAGVIVVASVGGPQTVEVKTDHGDFSDFEIEVDDGELTVSRKWNRLSWHNNKSDYKVMVSVRDLNSLEASSGAHAKIANIDAEEFLIDLSSGAHASLEGVCEECVLELSSGADLDAKELLCDTARIDVSSGGHGELSVNRTVIADASSGGHVSVYGSPERVDVDKSSGGRVKIKTIAQASRD
ncbi:MAG: DUF2807 domain-containing protein [Pseudomonadota bacterium]